MGAMPLALVCTVVETILGFMLVGLIQAEDEAASQDPWAAEPWMRKNCLSLAWQMNLVWFACPRVSVA